MAIFNWKPKLVLPTVYDDALSYQEILGKVVDELNRMEDKITEVEGVANTANTASEQNSTRIQTIEDTAPQFSLEGTTLTITLPA